MSSKHYHRMQELIHDSNRDRHNYPMGIVDSVVQRFLTHIEDKVTSLCADKVVNDTIVVTTTGTGILEYKGTLIDGRVLALVIERLEQEGYHVEDAEEVDISVFTEEDGELDEEGIAVYIDPPPSRCGRRHRHGRHDR